jgi:uncharacterized small protein (DUF1192 family)
MGDTAEASRSEVALLQSAFEETEARLAQAQSEISRFEAQTADNRASIDALKKVRRLYGTLNLV